MACQGFSFDMDGYNWKYQYMENWTILSKYRLICSNMRLCTIEFYEVGRPSKKIQHLLLKLVHAQDRTVPCYAFILLRTEAETLTVEQDGKWMCEHH